MYGTASAQRPDLHTNQVLTEAIGPILMEFQYKTNPVVHLCEGISWSAYYKNALLKSTYKLETIK